MADVLDRVADDESPGRRRHPADHRAADVAPGSVRLVLVLEAHVERRRVESQEHVRLRLQEVDMDFGAVQLQHRARQVDFGHGSVSGIGGPGTVPIPEALPGDRPEACDLVARSRRSKLNRCLDCLQ